MARPTWYQNILILASPPKRFKKRRSNPSAVIGGATSGIAIEGIDNKIEWNENSIMQKTD